MGDVIDREAFFENRKLSNLQLGLQQQAMEIMNVALLTPCEIGMEPVIGIPFYESSLGYVDTAPSEYCAPTDDSA